MAPNRQLPWNNDGPGSEEVVEGEEVQHQHAGQQERKREKLISTNMQSIGFYRVWEGDLVVTYG